MITEGVAMLGAPTCSGQVHLGDILDTVNVATNNGDASTSTTDTDRGNDHPADGGMAADGRGKKEDILQHHHSASSV